MTIRTPNYNANIPMASVGTLAGKAEPTFVFRLLGSIYNKAAGEDEAHPTVLTVEVSAKDEKAAEEKIAAGFTELVEAIAVINRQKELQRLAEERLRKGDNERLYPQVMPQGIVYKQPQDITEWTSDRADIKKGDGQSYFDMNDFKITLGDVEPSSFEVGGVKVKLDGDDNR